MFDLHQWENKIIEKRKNTDFRDFLMEIMSYFTFNLYKNNGFISVFSLKSKFKFISFLDFEIKRLKYEKFGFKYNFNQNFFDNFLKLAINIEYPNIALFGNNENSNFSHKVLNTTNCYLSFDICFSENVAYSVNVKDNCREVFNCVMVGDCSEIVYQSAGVYKSFGVFYSKFIFNCNNIYFSSNLIGCHDCIFCTDLENKSYCIKNKQYSKDEFLKLKTKILLNKDNFIDYFNKLSISEFQLISTNCSGKFIIKSADIENAYFIYNINNGKNTVFAGTVEGNNNLFDSSCCGSPRGNNYYGVIGAGSGDNFFCSMEILGGMNIYYSHLLENCSFCLGCIGLKNKSFCIMNIQYSKEEWYILTDKIFSQMEADGILGDFFPGSLNPFYFNDTIAYLIDDSFTKEEVEKEGYMWRDEKIKIDIPESAGVIYTNKKSFDTFSENLDYERYLLSDYQGYDVEGNWQIDKKILDKVIIDENGNYYKIIEMEYNFLMKHGLPLPEIHWLDRIKLGFKFK